MHVNANSGVQQIHGEGSGERAEGTQLQQSMEYDGRKSKYFCPFSKVREGVTLVCEWPPHNDRRSVNLV